MFYKRVTIFFLIAFALFLFFLSPAYGQLDETPKEETLETIVVKVIEEKEVKFPGSEQWQYYQLLELLVTYGSKKDEKILVENGTQPVVKPERYKEGDRLMVSYTRNEAREEFIITDQIRRDSLLWLFAIFIVLVLFVSKWQGLTALLGMVISFVVIFAFLLPQVSAGRNPILIAVLSSIVIIPFTFYLSHGFNKKTSVAILGTLISMVITGILASVFIEATKLSGFSSEEAGFLTSTALTSDGIKGLILSGIIIGVLGVLDDITVAQAAIVQQLKKANGNLQVGELYNRAMSVGKDHIASMVNTLILVYTGAALPLLLLFVDNPRPFSEVINYELIAEEIVRTLVASIGLVLAVPITTLIASFLASSQDK